MNIAARIVISASRRTDIPAFYMKEFMMQIQRGFFETINPFNRKVTVVQASPGQVHTIVFWSKNFGPFLDKGYGDILKKMGYRLFFNFTINSESGLLESGVPPLLDRLAQLERLSAEFTAPCIHWRFDPICFYSLNQAPLENNRKDFKTIAEAASRCGITRCVTSFMDHYAKIERRVRKLPGFSFVDIPLNQKADLILEMEKFLAPLDIRLALCCEKEVLEALPETSTVSPGACIPNELLTDLFGNGISLKKDAGQRIKKGCTCGASVDIGSYQTQPCGHNCLFCYANPSSEPIIAAHDGGRT